jgi:transcriptional regulator with XRE-family HTH domain
MLDPRKIRSFAALRGLRLQDVAEKCERTHSWLSQLMSGAQPWNLERATLVANALEVTVDELRLEVSEAEEAIKRGLTRAIEKQRKASEAEYAEILREVSTLPPQRIRELARLQKQLEAAIDEGQEFFPFTGDQLAALLRIDFNAVVKTRRVSSRPTPRGRQSRRKSRRSRTRAPKSKDPDRARYLGAA